MTQGFYVQVTADHSTVDKVLKQLEDRTSPQGLQDFLDDKVDDFIRNRISDRFTKEGDDVSGAWHPLEQATQQIRASYGYPADHPINVRTGQLKAFLVNSHSDIKTDATGATLQHPPVTGDAAMNKKIATAQSGSSYPSTPARPVIGVNQNDLLFVTSELVAYLMEGMI
jgi:hypothetical protein